MENQEVSLYEYWQLLKRRLKLIAVVTAGTFLISAILAFLSPNIYEAGTTFYYPLNDRSHSLGSIAQNFLGKDDTGVGAALVPSSHETNLQDYAKGILSSRKVTDVVID